MKIKEIEKKSEKEIKQLLQEKRERLRQINFSIATGKVKNVREIRLIKKDIARLLTVTDSKKEQENNIKK